MSHEDFIRYPVGKIPKGEFCNNCMRYNSRYVTCDTIAIDEKKVLLIRRAREPSKGKWAIPGGYLSWEETVEEAAVREFREETGYVVKDIKLLGIFSDPKRGIRQNVDITFYGHITGEQKDYDKVEITEMKWFSLDELPDDIAFDHKNRLGVLRKTLKI